MNDPIEFVYLHGFSDASTLAYGACVYIKSVSKAGNIKISFVTSKSRLVPLKKNLGTPRLELLGNSILAKLIHVVYNALLQEVIIRSYYCWSDSMISLAWIVARHKEFKPFVENRVILIRNLTPIDRWHYVSTKENVADIITRFNSIDLVNNSMWWKGPKFLYCYFEESSHDRKNVDFVNLEDSLLAQYNDEVKNICSVNLCLSCEEDVSKIIDLCRFSNLRKLYFVTALVLRFVYHLKRRVKGKGLKLTFIDCDEIQSAQNLWLKVNQRELSQDGNYFTNLENQLRLVKDDNEIYRCKGRLTNAKNIPYETRSPILLARKHKLTELIVLDCHQRLMHAGQRQTLTELRSRFWITKGKSYVKYLLNRCVICNRYNTKPYCYPKSPNLPSFRVDKSTPFSACGIDYIGPLYTKNVYSDQKEDEHQLFKCFVILYTCATTRGVVLDLVPDASAKTFVNSLKKFISRRGCPRIILSDNGTAFTAELTQNFAATRNIKWQFSLTEAPWFRGFWERLVSPVKRSMKKTLGNSMVCFNELQILLYEIELVLNSRPLGFVYDNDLEEILTPNHLLFGRKLYTSNSSIQGNVKVNLDLPKRIHHINMLLNHFWSRWRNEYVTSLRKYDKKYKRTNNIKPSINDIVIVFEEKQPRNKWMLGRVRELITGHDGKTRGVKIMMGKTKTVISRPVNKVYPLELVEENEEISKKDEQRSRPRRQAAIIADLKRKFVNK